MARPSPAPPVLRPRASSRRVNRSEIPDPEVPERAKRPRSYSARYKAEILAEHETLDREGRIHAPATRRRCQRSSVSGVTKKRTSGLGVGPG
jgi:hypothetical protein